MRSYANVEDACAAAIAPDTMEGYEEFLALHLRIRCGRRIAAMVAIRREEIISRRCVFDNSPPAYWSYLRRYPNGPYVCDARRRLAMIGSRSTGRRISPSSISVSRNHRRKNWLLLIVRC